jgi:hypothetical protein
MSITDELRQVAAKTEGANGRCGKLYRGDLDRIADRIDEAHKHAIAYVDDRDPEMMAENGWVRLPVDADGVPIRVGDVVTMQLLFGGESKPLVVDRMELSHGRDGDLWCVALDTDKGCWNQPSLLRHYHETTVEDVLEEFAQMYIACNDKGTIAEYAKKLRLAGEDE